MEHLGARMAAACGVVAALAAAPLPMAESPPAGSTGGFGEPSCVSCHTGNEVNAFGGEVRVVGLPVAYRGGEELLLTVVLEADETTVAGFQMSARFGDGPLRGRNAGELRAVDHRVARSDSAGITYLQQSAPGSLPPDPSGSSWTVSWKPPDSEHAVAVHVAANSGNGDESPLGDLVYVHALTVRPADR